MPNFPANLADVLGNPSIIKCGVGIQSDVSKLHRDWNVTTRGYVDLSLLARSADAQRKGRYAHPLGLARLVEMYKHRTLAKSKRVQMSDWTKPLTAIQQEYAANDAHAGLALYQHLISLAQRKVPLPKPV
jgi:ribonuclease D